MANLLTPLDKKLVISFFSLYLWNNYSNIRTLRKQRAKCLCSVQKLNKDFSPLFIQGWLNKRDKILNLLVYQWDLKGTAFLHNYRKEMLSGL